MNVKEKYGVNENARGKKILIASRHTNSPPWFLPHRLQVETIHGNGQLVASTIAPFQLQPQGVSLVQVTWHLLFRTNFTELCSGREDFLSMLFSVLSFSSLMKMTSSIPVISSSLDSVFTVLVKFGLAVLDMFVSERFKEVMLEMFTCVFLFSLSIFLPSLALDFFLSTLTIRHGVFFLMFTVSSFFVLNVDTLSFVSCSLVSLRSSLEI